MYVLYIHARMCVNKSIIIYMSENYKLIVVPRMSLCLSDINWYQMDILIGARHISLYTQLSGRVITVQRQIKSALSNIVIFRSFFF